LILCCYRLIPSLSRRLDLKYSQVCRGVRKRKIDFS
jgi:hypothetical protein